MKINAQPNINGNTPQDFEEAARTLFNAAHDFAEKLRVLDEVFHSRNYQHLSDISAKTRRQQDLLVLQELRVASETATKLAEAILNAGRENL